MKSDFIRDNPQIIQALRQVQNERADSLLAAAAESTYEPSPEFQRKMEQLIRTAQKPSKKPANSNGKKAILALAATFVFLIVTLFSVSAVRVPVLRFFEEVYEKFSAVFFVKDTPAERSETIERAYAPQWLPEGYALDETNRLATDFLHMTFYLHADGSSIQLQQTPRSGSGIILNTEDVQTEDVHVGKNSGLYYSNLGTQTLLWEDAGYAFVLTGTVDRDTLLAIACSLKEKSFEIK